jgi:hypothetical protein
VPEWIVTRRIVDEWTVEAETGPEAVKRAQEIHGETAGDTAPSYYEVATVDGESPCEGCGKPATATDVDGVPLCEECYELEVREAIEDAAGEGFDS